MSTYVDPTAKFSFNDLEAPSYLRDYLNYLAVIENFTDNTISSYYIQVRIFLRFIKCRVDGGEITRERLEQTSIADIPFSVIELITTDDIYDYLAFAGTELHNEAAARSMKLTVLRSFFGYLVRVARTLPQDVTYDIVTPKKDHPMPRYLALDEAYKVLDTVDGPYAARDYCILLLLLSCGMRVSELVKIDLNDIQDDKLRLQGKGRKERFVYLNDACVDAIVAYLKERLAYPKIADKNALFISRNKGSRMSVRRVQQIVEKALKDAGLAGKGLSTHKLRHTAATLMYQTGAANVLELKEILGHASVSTTELYTHVDDEQLRQAMKQSPFADATRA